MLSASRRFSSASSANSDSNAKSFMPPRPTFNSPKLVQDSKLAPSRSASLEPLEPDAISTSSSPVHAPQTFSPRQPVPSVRHSTKAGQVLGFDTSEFGALGRDVKQLDILQECFGSPASYHAELDLQGRRRSSTLGHQPCQESRALSWYDTQLSPQPIKSQFDDDSEDEEKMHDSRGFAGMPNLARLAALGTASRLFKNRRHSRTSSAAHTPPMQYPDLTAHLKIEKRRSGQNDIHCRPSTSEGTSPAPRQAVFGHRPSPSQLSIARSDKSDKSAKSNRSDKSDRARSSSVAQADLDLMLALQGKSFKPKAKPIETKKLLSKRPGHEPEKHEPQQPGQLSSSATDQRSQWTAPPPYCYTDSPALKRRESIRKSQSLSNLRFEANRSTGRLSPAIEQDDQPEQDEIDADVPIRAEPSAWQAIIDSSPSTYSDHSSASSFAHSKRSEEYNAPRRPTFKPQRLPPQKPPPQQCLPPPPLPPKISLPALDSVTPAVSDLVDADSSFLIPSSPSTDVKCSRAMSNAAASEIITQPLVSPKGTTSIDDRLSHAYSPSHLRAPRVTQEQQIELNVGGTKFVTLPSTLSGLPGDKPRLVKDLCHARDLEGPDTATPRSSSYQAPMQIGMGNERAGALVMTHNTGAETTAGIGISQPNASHSSSTSLSTLASTRDSHDDSDASTSRTSNHSDTDVSKTIHNSSDSFRAVHEHLTSDGPHRQALPAANVLSSDVPKSIFLDRNGDLYRDILGTLRTRKLPFRLLAASIAGPSQANDDAPSALTPLKLQLRCRLHELKDEADWLGYHSIVRLCDEQLCQI